MMPSQVAYSLVKASEGRHYAVYLDGGGHRTGGVGHKLKPGEYEDGATFSDQQIDEWLDADMEEASYIVRKHIKVPLDQGQTDALTSFAFQFGEDKFARYTLTKMINQGADSDDIQWQWMKYLYTIDDRDRDGDQDAVIDRGLPIRRLRELLIYRGFSWAVAEAAANANNVKFTESRIAWGVGGFKEVIDNIVELVNETIERARSLAAFMDEPDDYLFKDEPVEEVKAEKPAAPKAKPDPQIITDPTPETPLTTNDLNVMQAKALKTGRKMSFEPVMPVGSKPLSINTKMPEEVPYGIDPSAGLQPKEEAERVRRYTKKVQGIEMKQVGQGLTVTTGVIAGANQLAGETTTLFDKLGVIGITLMSLAFGIGILYWLAGLIREKWNARKEVEAEINATQGIY